MKQTIAAALVVAALLPSIARAETVVDPIYGQVEVQPDGGLRVPVRGGFAVVYRGPVSAAAAREIIGDEPAPVIQRYTENTVAPSAEEIASNPFLR